jgi:capsular polysaccharide biosynthesis protein
MLGIRQGDCRTFHEERPLWVGELTILSTDRFRPELLLPVRDALGAFSPGEQPRRRVFLSRSRAARRRLLNEDEVWPLLRDAAFERVWMEDLSFDEQVRLMGQTRVLFGLHGAGLTNMMFCPPGGEIVEIADLGFPNPNFYALACAMQHHYWVIPGRAIGEVHPLEKDVAVDLSAVEKVLANLN